MIKDIMIYIDDILTSIELIEEYIKDVSFNQFEKDIGIQDKVLRRLEIIGEAARRLPKDFIKKYKEIPWRQMIGLRNIIVHEYSVVNLREIWKIVFEELLETKRLIRKIKKEVRSLKIKNF